MDFKTWEPIYVSILKDFDFSREEDWRSAEIFSELLGGKNLATPEQLDSLIRDKVVFVIGGGMGLINELYREDIDLSKGIVIVADGATSTLRKIGSLPNIIVTDLDGNIEDQVTANERGAIAVIHAHGDNIDQISRYTSKFEGKVIGTVQCKPFGNLQNFGGFTDGDRAVFLAKHFGAERIVLLGFDFENVTDKPNCDKDMKLRKLRWAKRLISSLGVEVEKKLDPY